MIEGPVINISAYIKDRRSSAAAKILAQRLKYELEEFRKGPSLRMVHKNVGALYWISEYDSADFIEAFLSVRRGFKA